MSPIQLADISDVHDKSFDYVVIGAGTSGLALATRLAEDPAISVLVLEAGKYHGDEPSTRLPAMYAKNFDNPDYDWAFATTPQSHADNTTYIWHRGKGLGGSSALNFYVWNRPPAVDIDAWEKLGNPGWNWANYLKYSNKVINFIPPPDTKVTAERQTSDPAYYGTSGPITVGFPNGSTGWDVTLQDTLNKIGIKTITDGSGGQGIGTFMVTSTVDPRTNARKYSVDYVPSPQPSNLTILSLATVTRVLLSKERPGSDAIATEVEFLFDDQKKTVKASKEVLVSAGAIKSPQILELSGIGDRDILQKAGVESIVDLPAVGTNVQEHLYVGISCELNDPENFNTLDPLHDPEIAAENLQLYQKGEGLFLTGLLNLTHTPLSLVSTHADAIHGAFTEKLKAGKYLGKPGITEQLEVQLDVAKNGAETELISFPCFLSTPNPPEPGKKYISLVPAINHPFSRGTIHIASADPLASPAIDPHYLEEDVDLQTFLEQVKFARRVGTLAPLSAHVGKEINPGPDIQTDEQLTAWLKKNMNSVYHTAGSCSMLPRDKGGVVDPQLKVYGTANVRVVDLSIVPLHVAAHTQATAYTIAEQAADIIKGHFKA
ncbi:GMC oxidoreductase [Auriscalpium vulgare]|uniref:GMC oxidoreductase n=1 Tax=Auriscalpium vulgare TaxID=40419 RepID=A0ACB8RQH8_9AGAM|nr:GMC oxidoreductase [Auriscalpium vulgare]